MDNTKVAVVIVPLTALLTEIKLSVNNRLYEQGYITEEMYSRAREIIVRRA